MSGKPSRWELNDEQRKTTARAGKGVKAALGVVKSLLFGSDDEAAAVLEQLAEDAHDQVERRRGGVIDVTGEPVETSTSSSSSSPRSSRSTSSPATPATPVRVTVRCPCKASETLERRGRADDVLVAAFAALGWRRPVSGGWRCPDCAAKGGAHG